MASVQYTDADFTIFNNIVVNNHCLSIKQCNSLQRILNALKYYQTLQVLNDIDLLMEFCTETYQHLIDDFSHIIKNHHNDMESIYEFAHQSLPLCSITSCIFYKRWNTDRQYFKSEMKQTNDLQLMFWRDLLDQIHSFILHLYDGGLRIKKNDLKKDDIFCDSDDIHIHEDENDNQRYNSCFDSNFDSICKHLTSQRTQLNKLGLRNTRMKNNKFNINTGYVKTYPAVFDITETETTFMDGFYSFLKQQNVNVTDIYTLRQYLTEEQYDTDAMVEDCNIAMHMKNIKYVENIIKYRQFVSKHIKNAENKEQKYDDDDAKDSNSVWSMARKIMKPYYDELKERFAKNSSTFSIGYTFYYWNWYKNKNVKQNWIGNQNDHLGYSTSQLFIRKKYESLKDELLNNNIHVMKESTYQRVFTKVSEYARCNAVKSITAANEENEFHYGIKQGSTILFGHLIAIISYTDLSSLSAAFSSTFRALQPNESLLSIKARNREYWHLSKLIREAVQYYGNKLGSERKDPFYTGISYVILPSFVIRLCSPTSTSKQIEVAHNFADQSGIVIQINNGSNYYSQFLRCFDCSWISCYADEDEHLFCGGDCPLRVESVTLVSTKQNLYWFFKPLFYLDCMVSGVMITPNSNAANLVKKKDHRILLSLINHKLSIKKNKYLKYVNDTFAAFCEFKKQLIFNIDDINAYLSSLKDILFESTSWNLLNIELVSKIFTECETIWIYDEVNQCKFDLFLFGAAANTIIQSSHNKISSIHVKALRAKNGTERSWLTSRTKIEDGWDILSFT